ncbi:MAG: polyamine ABC transporter ATP-binding protein [Holosporales bacterium]|jgi:putrescine transport system ATP-binding protein|nr:polyamine ABC transporter ATP-binding protein [Holosporales bacterium]
MVNQPQALGGMAETVQEAESEAYVKIENISKSHDKTKLLQDVSLDVHKGELFSLLGKSGSGKTTLLRILAGLEKPTSGKVYVDGVDVTDVPVHKRPINMMFQSYALFPHMTVKQNVAFGLVQDRLGKAAIEERVKDALNLVQLGKYGDRKPHQLSGGQRQRVALARSLAKIPKLLLLDEPLAALDKSLKERTQFELVNIHEKVGITFILVTHDQAESMIMATRMAIIEDGKIRQVGTPHDIYEFPNSRTVAEFIGNINLFNCIVVEQDSDHVLLKSSEIDCLCYATQTGAVPIGSSLTLAIRPEKIMMSKLIPAYPRNWAQGVIKEIAYLGSISVYHVQLNSGKMVTTMLPNLLRLEDRGLTWEDTVYLFWRSESCLILTS